MNKSIIILFFGILLSIFIRTFFIINGLDVADVNKLHLIAKVVLNGGNPYKLIDFSISTYPPVGYYLEAVTLLLSNLFGIPFHILTKIWPNLADIAIGLLLYRFLIKLKTKPIYASLWSLVYILNPISIIISAAHGQIDSITSLLVLCSLYIMILRLTKSYSFLSALFLGFAITIKPNPTILIPFFLIFKGGKLKEKIIFIFVCATPLALSFTPYIWQNSQEILINLIGYSGVYDFGYPAILRGLWYQNNASIWLPFSQELLQTTKLAFLSGTFLLLTIFAQSNKLLRSCLAIYLLFLGVYYGISAQYLVWILPIAVMLKEKMIIIFTVSGTIALLGFYTFFGPEILFEKFWHGAAFQSKYMLIYFIGNLLLWATTLWWLFKISKNHIHTSFKTFSPFHKKIILTSLAIFIISLVPVLQLVFNLIQQLNNP